MPAAQLLLNWPYDILSFFFNVLSCSSIMIFFLFNVSEKSSDALTNNESWTSFCYLYHKYDSTVPADNVISGPHFWTLRSVTSKISSQRHCFPTRGSDHHLVSYAQSVLQLRYLTQKNQQTQVEQGWSQSRQPREHLITPAPRTSRWTGHHTLLRPRAGKGWGRGHLQRMCWARASPTPPTGGNIHTILE